jgi:hypothetical protein
MNYEIAKDAVITLLDEAKNARQDAANLRALLAHATVQLRLWQEHRLDDEKRRAELFAMNDDGTLMLSIGGGRCIAEIPESA